MPECQTQAHGGEDPHGEVAVEKGQASGGHLQFQSFMSDLICCGQSQLTDDYLYTQAISQGCDQDLETTHGVRGQTVADAWPIHVALDKTLLLEHRQML